MTLKIGFAQTPITPSLERPVYLAGFGQGRRAESNHDDLYACSLAIRDDQTTCVLAALDLIGFLHADVCEVIDRVHAAHSHAQVLIASVHPHHGPDTIGLWGPDMKTSGIDPEYMHLLKDKVTETILSSLEGDQPAMLKFASVQVPGLAKNARDPGIRDEELTVAQFIGEDGKTLASLFDFPCHPEVLWEHNPHITADYVGVLRKQVQAQTQAPCIFFAGALGGMMTPDVTEHSFEEAESMGRVLAEQGLRALEEAPLQEHVSISLARRPVPVKLTNPLYKLAFRRKLLRDARDPQGRLTSEVSLVRIGGLWLAAVPGELLPKLGLQLKAKMKAAGGQVTGIIGLANDELGYILPVEDFRFPLNPFRPGKHYEETNSIGKGIAPAVMQALDDLIQGAEHD